MGGDFKAARRLVPTDDTAKFLGGWVIHAVVDLQLLEERTAVGVKNKRLDWESWSDGEWRREDAVELVVLLFSLVRETRGAKIFVSLPLGHVGSRLVRATISWRMATYKFVVPRNVVARVGTEGLCFAGGVFGRRSLERKMDQTVLDKGRAGLSLRVLETELVGEVRAEFLGVGQDQFNGTVQLGLDISDGLMLGLQELAKSKVL